MHGVPGILGVIPQGVELLSGAALLLDPCVILEVMHTLTLFVAQLQHVVVLEVEDMQVMVELCLVHIVVAVHLFELLDAALIHIG